ncbi:MAG: hypothetical protein OSA98_20525 [Rubripirellula sp.]|nr:hypothetical protein [Rubripirellula sp.]
MIGIWAIDTGSTTDSSLGVHVPACSTKQELQGQAGGQNYEEMVGLARPAGFRHALWQVAEAIVSLFEQVIQRAPHLQRLDDRVETSWAQISSKWKLEN